MKKETMITLAKCMAFVLAAAVSFFVLSDFMTREDTFENTIKNLNEKQVTVTEMAAAATGASAAITLLPGDAGTPIAEKLLDLTGYFVIILAAIYLEKILVTITGYIAFRWLVPIAFLMLAVNVFARKERLRQVSWRVIVFAGIMTILIPASVVISNRIEANHELSVQQALENTRQATQEIENNADAEDEGVIAQFFDKVKGGVSGELKKFEAILGNFIDLIAMLIVTTCLIPIGVLLLLFMLAKSLFGLTAIPDGREMADKLEEVRRMLAGRKGA